MISNGKCIKEVKEILKIAADYNAIVATGHISPSECMVVLDANANIGAKNLVTHPNLWFEDFTLDVLKSFVKGKAIIEFTAGGLTPRRGRGDPEDIVSAMEMVN